MEMSVQQFAARHSLSPQSIYAMVNHGKLSAASKKVDGRVLIDTDMGDRIMRMGAASRTKRQGRKIKSAHKHDLGLIDDNTPPDLNISLPTPLVVDDTSGMDDADRLVKAQADEKEQLALLAEIKVRQQQGLLMEREQVAKEVFKIARMMREGVTNIPSKVAPEVAAMDDPFAIQKHLERQFRDVLTDLSNAIAKLGVPDADQPV